MQDLITVGMGLQKETAVMLEELRAKLGPGADELIIENTAFLVSRAQAGCALVVENRDGTKERVPVSF